MNPIANEVVFFISGLSCVAGLLTRRNKTAAFAGGVMLMASAGLNHAVVPDRPTQVAASSVSQTAVCPK